MMTAGEKKRLFWVLMMIIFFFANLILATVVGFRGMGGKPAASGSAAAPATQATQP